MSTHGELGASLSAADKRALLGRLLREKANGPMASYEPSPAQRALWLAHGLEPTSTAHHVTFAVRVVSGLDVPAFHAALRRLVDRHAMLRAAFPDDGESPRLEVQGARDVALRVLDASGWDDPELAREVRRRMAEPFDLRTGPLLRVSVFTRAPDDHVLLLVVHHIACDARGLDILLGELAECYRAELRGETPALPPSTAEFAHYLRTQAARLAGAAGAVLRTFWEDQLAGELPSLDLPADRPRSPHPPMRGAVHPFTIEEGLYRRLEALARAEGKTLFTVLLGAYQTLLMRYSGQEDILVGVPMSGRLRAEYEAIVGHFVNWVVIRSRVSAESTFREHLARAGQDVRAAVRHQEYPFLELVKRIRPVWRTGRSAIFHATLNVIKPQAGTPVAELAGCRSTNGPIPWGPLQIEPYPLELIEEHYDLALKLIDTGQLLLANLQYDADMFDPESMERLGRALKALLADAADRPDTTLGDLAILDAIDRRQVLESWNATTVESPRVDMMHELVGAQARRRPSATAVESTDQILTYGELNARANRLAHHLRRLGAGPESRVGICIERSPEMVVGLLAILKAGTAYVPLDPDLPPKRLAFMIEDAGISLVVTSQQQLGRLPASTARAVCMDTEESIGLESPEDPSPWAAPENLAYILYTSGSSGIPKGVMVEHRALSHYLSWCLSAYFSPGGGGSPLHSSIAFDLSVTASLATLAAGQRIRLVPHGPGVDGLTAVLREDGPFDVVKLTPAHLRLLAGRLSPEEAARCARVLVIGGEALTAADIASWCEAAPRTDLVNEYGPTEATVGCCVHTVTDGKVPASAAVPIGRPIPNMRLYVLDRRMRPVPLGIPGELYIAGDGLARGYLGRPDLTARRFIPDPFGETPGGRLYQTGDLVRYRQDGSLEYLGRIDAQLKVRGFRVEPGEIEAALLHHPAVSDAVVLASEDQPGERRLAAYVVLRADQAPDAGELRAFLKTSLPDYMVPSFFVPLPALPLTTNGKLDRKALPVPEAARPGFGAGYVAARNPAERILAEIWGRILQIEWVGIHDNFFDLGGDSILAIQVLTRARRAGLHLSSNLIFQHPTIAELAAAGADAPTVTLSQEALTGPVPLTPIQRWFFEQALPEPQRYNQGVLFELPLSLTAAQWTEVQDHILEHHDALRLRFVRLADDWAQSYAPPGPSQPIDTLDLSHLEETEWEAALAEAAERLHSSLDLATGPLLRATLVRRGGALPEELLVIVHHLAIDGMSWRILQEDLETLCGQVARGQPMELPPKTTSYRQWAERLIDKARSGGLEDGRAYWLAAPEGPSSVPLPRDFPGGSLAVGSSDSLTVELGPDETRSLLQEVPRTYGTRVNDALLTALVQAFAGLTGTRRLRLTLEGHGREEPDLDLSRTVGWFTSIFPIQLDLTGADGQAAALKSIKEQLRGIPDNGLAHGLLRYLADDADVAARLRESPSPEVLFNYFGQLVPASSRSGIGRTRSAPGKSRHSAGRRSHLLEIDALVNEGRLRMTWTYSREIHRAETIRSLASACLAALRDLIAHCRSPEAGGCTPSDVPMAKLDQAQLDALSVEGGRFDDVYPLSPTQEGMLFHSIESRTGDYFLQTVIRLRGSLDDAALTKAWAEVIERHPIFRTRVEMAGPAGPLQVVQSRVAIPVDRQDWRGWSTEVQSERLEAFLRADRLRGFDLSHAPLMRLAIVREEDAVSSVIWSYHHFLLDGWSTAMVLNELFDSYRANLRGEAIRRDRPGTYRDYVAWRQRYDPAAAEPFWREELREFAAPTPLGIELTGRAVRGRPVENREQALRLSVETTQAIRGLARQHRLTVSSVVLGAWALLLSRYSGRDDVVFGVTVSGRSIDLAGVEGIVGPFINTLPLRIRVPARERLGPWLRDLQERQVRMRDYEQSPLHQVRSWAGEPGDTSLFDSILAVENYPVEPLRPGRPGGLELIGVRTHEQTNYPLTVIAIPGPELEVRVLGDAGRLVAGAIPRLLGHLRTLFEGMAADPSAALSDLPLLSHEERRELSLWNDTAVPYPEGDSISSLFEAQAARTPGAVALECGDRRLTYAELDRLADRLARLLRRHGVGPDALVAICDERSIEFIVGLLAILKAGGAYVPLDPDYPPARLAFMLRDTVASVLLTRRCWLDRLPDHAARTVLLDDSQPGEDLEADAGGRCPSAMTPDRLAYVMYTSGSTGRPKGVSVPHRAVVRLIFGTDYARLDDRTCTLHLSAVSFDASTFEIWAPLLLGGRCALLPGGAPSALELGRAIVRHRVDTIFLTTAFFNALVDEAPEVLAPLGQLLIGGEALSVRHVRRFLEACPGTRLINGYGPTEGTTFSSSYRIPADFDGSRGSVPIGRPIGNTLAYVLDGNLEPTPVGVPGELYIGGDGLARGYLGRADLTAEKFIPAPSPGIPGARLYKTGDRVRLLADGNLEFLGRFDDQVKIRGFRIEPGEVESVLSEDPRIRAAAVVVGEDEPGEKRMVAYVVPEPDRPFELGRLRASLLEKMPEYMVPSAFITMSALPLSPNGKIDRAALPSPREAGPVRERAFVAPRTELERILAETWAEVLGVESVGVDDDFWELGGHSLTAMRILARVQDALRIRIEYRTLFEGRTIASLAGAIERAGPIAAVVTRPVIAPVSRAARRVRISPQGAIEGLGVIDELPPEESLGSHLQ